MEKKLETKRYQYFQSTDYSHNIHLPLNPSHHPNLDLQKLGMQLCKPLLCQMDLLPALQRKESTEFLYFHNIAYFHNTHPLKDPYRHRCLNLQMLVQLYHKLQLIQMDL